MSKNFVIGCDFSSFSLNALKNIAPLSCETVNAMMDVGSSGLKPFLTTIGDDLIGDILKARERYFEKFHEMPTHFYVSNSLYRRLIGEMSKVCVVNSTPNTEDDGKIQIFGASVFVSVFEFSGFSDDWIDEPVAYFRVKVV